MKTDQNNDRKYERKLKRLAEPGVGIHLFFLIAFAAATLYFKQYYLAAAEASVIVVLLIYSLIARRIKERQLSQYVESIAYRTENAKDKTLVNFPLPIAVFRLDDASIVWGNDMFFDMCGKQKRRLDARISEMLPQFSGKWLLEGKTQYPSILEINSRKYQVHGNLIRSDEGGEGEAFMGTTYWVDVTDYDDIRLKYEASRPVPGVIIIDNMEELSRNQSERVINDIRDNVFDALRQWCDEYHGILRRYDRDRFFVMFEKQDLDKMKEKKMAVVEQMHQIQSPNGIQATVSLGFGEDGKNLGEGLQFADMAVELALSRGGDQAVVKNRLSFEFFGGRGIEVEKRSKVKTRVVANTLAELIRDSSKVYIMGHRFADYDAIGAAVGVCCLVRKCGKKASIVLDMKHNAVMPVVERLRAESAYKDAFLGGREALLTADGRTLLVVVDTNRPEQVEDADLLSACNRVAVIDHHRVAATYIQNAALGFLETGASSTCEMLTELLQEQADLGDVLPCEADAMLAGIVLDTKSFVLRTGESTFDAAAWLRRAGADPIAVKRMFQNEMGDTVDRYRILQCAVQHRNVAIAAPEDPPKRVVAAQAADELLNIAGVDASVVVAPDGKGGCFVSARSIGEMNVQILMEKLGGGGNRNAAAAQFADMTLDEAVERVKKAIDEYLGS